MRKVMKVWMDAGKIRRMEIDIDASDEVMEDIAATTALGVLNDPGAIPPEQQQVVINAIYEARQKYLVRKAAIDAGLMPDGLIDQPFESTLDSEEWDVRAERFRPAYTDHFDLKR